MGAKAIKAMYKYCGGIFLYDLIININNNKL
jgi:hypothetical protein